MEEADRGMEEAAGAWTYGGSGGGSNEGEKARAVENWGRERGTRAAPLVSGTATLTAGEQPLLFASGKRLPLANLYGSSPVVRV